MYASCEVILERQALLTTLNAEGPPQHLLDPDFLLIAPALGGVCLWTAAMNAELLAAGAWDHLIVVSRSRVAAILARGQQSTVRLTFAGRTLVVDRTMIDVADAERSISVRLQLPPYPRSVRQRELFPMAAEGRSKSRRPQLPARGLPLFA